LKIYSYSDLSKQEIESICLRQLEDDITIQDRVKNIVDAVKTDGDKALFNFAKQFDQVELAQLFIDKKEIGELAASIPSEAKAAIDTAYQNIKTFMLHKLKKKKR